MTRGMNMRDMKSRSEARKTAEKGSGFRVWGSGEKRFRVQGLGFKPGTDSSEPTPKSQPANSFSDPKPSPRPPPPFTRDKRPHPSFDRPSFQRPGPPEDEETEVPENMGEGILVDQGDGMHVSAAPRARSSRDDQDERDCPSEPPPGWGEG